MSGPPKQQLVWRFAGTGWWPSLYLRSVLVRVIGYDNIDACRHLERTETAAAKLISLALPA